MQKQIHFKRQTNFIGCDGYFCCTGINVFTLDSNHSLMIAPLTSGSEAGRDGVEVRRENIPALILALEKALTDPNHSLMLASLTSGGETGRFDIEVPRESIPDLILALKEALAVIPPVEAVPTNDAEPRFMATFRPQEWQNDYAVDVDEGKVEFDATGKLLSLQLYEIREFQENDYDSDYLADGLPERENHDGPFEVDADLDGWLEQNGIEDRSTMTRKQLHKLQKKYGVQF